MKFLHVIKNDKFIPDFIDFLESKFDFSDHVFFIFGNDDQFPIKRHDNVYFFNERNFISSFICLLKLSHKAKKIFLHGFFDIKIILFYWLFRGYLSKSFWLVWGGELYCREKNLKSIKGKIKEFFRIPFIKNMGHIVTSIDGDYENAAKWYGCRAPHYPYFTYPASLYHDIKNNKSDTKIRILIGNSADPSNNHKEVFERIVSVIDSNVEIICPLSYGNESYKKEILSLGASYFGEKFTPLIDYMEYNDYIALLSTINIAIFNHDRQQGMSNARVLLGAGCKIYMRENVSSTVQLKKYGIKLYKLQEFNLDICDEVIATNSDIIRECYSEEKLTSNLRALFK